MHQHHVHARTREAITANASSTRPAVVLTLFIAALLIATIAAFSATSAENATAATATPPATVTWIKHRWFLSGANMPYITSTCDFGCRSTGGVIEHRALIDRTFTKLSEHGVKVVRWYLFPKTAWQITRDGGGSPTGFASAKVYADLDVALEIAAQHDVYLDLVLFPDVQSLPATWFAQPTQREALAGVLAPLFHRYSGNSHLLSWEIVSEPEHAVDAATITQPDATAFVQRLTAEVHAQSTALASVGELSVDRIGAYTGIGLDLHAPHGFTTQTGAACATCTTTAALATAYGADAPVVIGATDVTGSTAAETQRLASYRTRGYAGVFTWSVRRRPEAKLGSARPTVPLAAHRNLIYARSSVGPRERVLNPCLGPQAATLMCPNLQMSPPDSFMLRRVGSHVRLLSRNSINSVGRGPAELHGRRSGHFTMAAVQRIHRRAAGSRSLTVKTGAQLFFKAIPGQYRYWKWRNAATMELWRIDGAGVPTTLVRRGPKTVYCLRDLKRTRGGIKRSPRSAQYPGCSQELGQQERTLGTSVGWSDIYPASYHENWIDVTGLKGCFAYMHVVDPTNVIYEYNEHDNRSMTVVRLPWRGSNAGCPGAKKIPGGTPGANGY